MNWRNYGILALAAVALLVLATPAAADILEMKDGTVIEGKFIGGSQNNVKMEVAGEIRVYSLNDVLSVTFTGGARGASESAGGAPAAATAPAAAAPEASSSAVTVPAGTRITVRMAETLDSRQQKAGYKFTAALEADLLADNGNVIAPRGSKVYGVITESKQSRRLAGKSEMKVTFTDIMINNQLVPIQSGDLQAKSEGTGKNTGRKVARGAAIGGLIDGSDGAKTGAKVGAGAALLTSGESIYIPSGTLVDFPLAAPLTLSL